MAKDKPELAYKNGVQRTLPTDRASIAVTSTSSTTSLSAYAGKWIWLQAKTLDVTVLRKSQTLTAGAGLVLKTTDDYREFYVDPDGDLTLSHISTGAASIDVLFEASE